MSDNRLLEKIAALLSRAENSDSEHEAELAMKKAQELSTLYSIDLAKARLVNQNKAASATPVRKTINVGTPGQRGLRTFTDLLLGICAANDVKVLISRDATTVYAHGFAEDIEATEALFASLSVQMVSASEAFKKTGEWKKDTTYRAASYKKVWQCSGGVGHRHSERWCDYDFDYQPGGEKPVSWTRARIDFQSAFGRRIKARLLEAKLEARDAAEAAEVAGDVAAAGTALALRNKEVEVNDFYKEHSRHARGSYGGQRTGGAHTSSRAGRAAGSSARLGSQSAFGGSRGAISA